MGSACHYLQAGIKSVDLSEDSPLLPILNDVRKSNRKLSISQCFKSIVQNPSFVMLAPIAVGIALWFGLEPTDGLTPTAIRLLAVFTSCIIALIMTSMDISVIVLTGLTLLAVTQSFECVDKATGLSTECRLCGEVNPLTDNVYDCHGPKDAFNQSLKGFSSSVVWLIFAAFHLGKAVQVTQLGRRLSLWMIAMFGKHILGLAYAIVLSELVLAPFVPSNTARGGGIVLPVVQSIATTLGSSPQNNSAIGAYLMLVASHANLLSASMYLTGMASNPIVVAKANQLFPHLNFGFVTWFTGSIVPALFCAIALPILLYHFCGMASKNEQMSSGENITKHAQVELEAMGCMSLRECQLCFVLLGCLCLWISTNITGLDSTLVALLGIVCLLHMRTITWKDIATNTSAWDTLFWLGGFVTIAEQLSETGASAYLGQCISDAIEQLALPPVPALATAYFLTTFMFSSLSAHTVAFVATFLEAAKSVGAHAQILTALLAYFGALGGCMTNFSTGSAAMFYAQGYVHRSTWFIVGLKLALFYLVVYFSIGMLWWKMLGWH
ncbi:Sodium/sulfate symporter [Gongronella butleri]|nr:Sodium/sulfate symporter [Gongronella butleri]